MPKGVLKKRIVRFVTNSPVGPLVPWFTNTRPLIEEYHVLPAV